MSQFVICGFSGAGKSQILKELGQIQQISKNFNLIDLDIYIAKILNKNESDLGAWIEEKGLSAFRDREFAALGEVLDKENIIVALGAGALENRVIDLLDQKKVNGLWLNTPFSICWDRIKGDSNRPLVKKGEKFMNSLFKSRIKIYCRYKEVSSLEDIIREIQLT